MKDNYPLLADNYAVPDGLKLYLEQAGDIIQNMFQNRWTHDHYVENVFVFSPNGVIIGFTTNGSGAMHDSKICDWGGLYEKLENKFENTGGNGCG